MVRGHSRKDGLVSSGSSGIRKTSPGQSILDQPWSDKEDKTIFHLRTVGWGWMAISKKLPGRRWAACRFRFHHHLITQYKWDNSNNSLDRSCQKSQPDMWLKVAEQMAAPWRLTDPKHCQGVGKHELARHAAISASSEEDRSRDATRKLVSQVNNLPELRKPIENDTTVLPSFSEMFSDIPSTHSAPK